MPRLLAVIDVTAQAAEALERAIDVAAAAPGSELILLFVEPEPPAWTHVRQPCARDDVAKVLANAHAAAATRGVPATIRLETGEKADVVTRVANEEGCDQIFVSEPPPTWASRTLMALSAACTGRAAGRIISGAGIPVTVVAGKDLS